MSMSKRLAMLLLVLVLPAPALSADRPNFLFIIADDASRDSLGAYGCQYIRTPNFDRLRAKACCLPMRTTAIQNVLRPALAWLRDATLGNLKNA